MLTRCPSCQASVLDDDAEECPFCGSPMDPAKAKDFQPASQPAKKSSDTGKAATKSKAPSPAGRAKASPSGARTARRQAGSPSKAASKSATSDDPFAVDPSAMSGVIKLAPKPSQKRPQKIVCPMCETVGYAPMAASGKDIRCANPKCMVPVFTAPDFAAPKREEIEPPSSTGTTLVVVAVAVVVFGGGFAYWWTNVRVPPAPNNGPTITDNKLPNNPDADATQDNKTETDGTNETVPSVTAAEVRTRAFASWPTITQPAQIARRPLRLRYAAESFAISGQLEQARAELAKIDDAEDRFYRIGPLVEIAWAEMAQSKGDASATLKELGALRNAIPSRGLDSARNEILWSAAMASGPGDAAAARALVTSGGQGGDLSQERLLASLEAAAALDDYDLEIHHRWRPVLDWNHPQSVAVAFNLIRHGHLDQAKRWAIGAVDPLAKAEALGAWASARIRAGDSAADEVRAAVASLDPAIRLYVLSRAAVRAIAEENTKTAEALFTDISSVAGEINPATPLKAENAGALYRINLASTSAERLRAAALAEAAGVAGRLAKPEPAMKLLWQAIGHLRAWAPSVADVAARQKEFDAAGLAAMRNVLETQLEVNKAEASDAASAYRRRLPRLRAAAETSLAAQAQILARAIGWGMGDAVLKESQSRAADGGAGGRFLSGSAGGRLWAAFWQAGNRKASGVLRQAGVTDRNVPLVDGMALRVWAQLEKEGPTAAGAQLAASTWNQVSEAQRLALGLRVVSHLSRQGNGAAIREFMRPIQRASRREGLYRGWGAKAAASGHGMDFLDHLESVRTSLMDRAAALRGLTAGLAQLSQTEVAAANEDDEPASRGDAG